MKAHLTLIGAVLLLTACTPPAHSSSPAYPSSAASRPSASPAASPTVPPVVVPGEEPMTAPCAYSPAGIPDRVVVIDVFHAGSQGAEACVDHGAEEAYLEYLPDPCGRDLGVKTSSIVARRAVEVAFDDNPADAYPAASMYRHTVTVYNSSDAASAYLSSVRAAVRECPVRTFASSKWKYTIVSGTAQRLELSVRHIAEHPEGGEPPSADFRISIFRSGARVSVLADLGWEGYPSVQSAVDTLVKAASEQLDRWE